jgi:hypothetical protein
MQHLHNCQSHGLIWCLKSSYYEETNVPCSSAVACIWTVPFSGFHTYFAYALAVLWLPDIWHVVGLSLSHVTVWIVLSIGKSKNLASANLGTWVFKASYMWCTGVMGTFTVCCVWCTEILTGME